MPDLFDFIGEPIASSKEVFNNVVYALQTTRGLGSFGKTLAIPQLATLYHNGKEAKIADVMLGNEPARIFFKPVTQYGSPGFSLNLQCESLPDGALSLSFFKHGLGFRRDISWSNRGDDFITGHQDKIHSLEDGPLKKMIAAYQARGPRPVFSIYRPDFSAGT